MANKMQLRIIGTFFKEHIFVWSAQLDAKSSADAVITSSIYRQVSNIRPTSVGN